MMDTDNIADILDGATETEAAELMQAIEISRMFGGVVITVVANDEDMENRANEFRRLMRQYEEAGAGIIMPDTPTPICFVAVPKDAKGA